MKKIPLLLVLMMCVLNSFAQLIITPATLPVDNVQNILTGTGVNISNVQFTGNINSLGVFATGSFSTGLGLSRGLVLSTGMISTIADSSSHFSSTNSECGSDPQLANLSTNTVNDAAVLEFDFIPSSDSIEFRYVFASEEYPEYVGAGTNDVFGFFLSGTNPAGGVYANFNLATIPNTNLPISINTVNNSTHSEYYVNNTNNSRIVFDGMTVVLTAKARVVPCESYHVKIAIGDVTDRIYDSGVFLEAYSFSSNGGSFRSGVVSHDTAICSGNSVHELSLSNNTGPIVRWESSVFPFTTWNPIEDTSAIYNPGILTETTVFHAVVQSPCSQVSSRTATILVDSMPIPNFSFSASGLNVEFINESAYAVSYIWNFGTESAISTEMNPTYIFDQPGQYNVELTAKNGRCVASYSQIIVLTGDDLEEFSDIFTCLYPNPTKGKVYIKLDNKNSADVNYNVIDILGKTVLSNSITGKEKFLELDLSHIAKGTYVVHLSYGLKTKSFKVIVE